jgi:hypothetical protein
MFIKIIDALLDKALTADFWRGILYVVAGLGVTLSPENAATIVSVTLVVSGIVHTIWHKAHPELPNAPK